MVRYCITARKLRNSQAGGGQRHRQRPFVTSNRIELTGRFLATGTRPAEATSQIVSFCVTLIWCSLLSVCCRRLLLGSRVPDAQFVTCSSLFSSSLISRHMLLQQHKTQDRRDERSDRRVTSPFPSWRLSDLCARRLFFPTQRKFRTDSMCLRSAPLAAACVTGTYPQNRPWIPAELGSRLRAILAFPRRTPSSLLLRCSLRPHGWGPHKLVRLWPLRRLRAEISMTSAAARRRAPAAVTAPT